MIGAQALLCKVVQAELIFVMTDGRKHFPYQPIFFRNFSGWMYDVFMHFCRELCVFWHNFVASKTVVYEFF